MRCNTHNVNFGISTQKDFLRVLIVLRIADWEDNTRKKIGTLHIKSTYNT